MEDVRYSLMNNNVMTYIILKKVCLMFRKKLKNTIEYLDIVNDKKIG
jgi:hypothetical protein